MILLNSCEQLGRLHPFPRPCLPQQRISPSRMFCYHRTVAQEHFPPRQLNPHAQSSSRHDTNELKHVKWATHLVKISRNVLNGIAGRSHLDETAVYNVPGRSILLHSMEKITQPKLTEKQHSHCILKLNNLFSNWTVRIIRTSSHLTCYAHTDF